MTPFAMESSWAGEFSQAQYSVQLEAKSVQKETGVNKQRASTHLSATRKPNDQIPNVSRSEQMSTFVPLMMACARLIRRVNQIRLRSSGHEDPSDRFFCGGVFARYWKLGIYPLAWELAASCQTLSGQFKLT